MHTGARNRAARQGGKAERAMLLSERARWAAAWAETHAERGDYEYALKWLEVARKSTGGLTPRQLEHRRLWRSQLQQTVLKQG